MTDRDAVDMGDGTFRPGLQAEPERPSKALRVRYDGTNDTYHLQFPTWERYDLDFTEVGRLLAGEGVCTVAIRGILAAAMEADGEALLVSYVVGSESFVTSPSTTPVQHEVEFSRRGFTIIGTYTTALAVGYDLGLDPTQYNIATSERYLRGLTGFHYIATHDAPASLVMLAESLGGTGLSRQQAAKARGVRTDASAPPIPEDAFPVLRYFTYEHLPEHLQPVSRPLCLMARQMVADYGASADQRELTKALDRLLESKDALVRAVLK